MIIEQLEVDGENCMLEMIELMGTEEYPQMRDNCIKTGEGFMLVYSIISNLVLMI